MTEGQQPVWVLGATGAQGGAVVDALLDRAVDVRAMVRDPASTSADGLRSRGLEVVVAPVAVPLIVLLALPVV